MDEIALFEEKLMKLDPQADDIVLQIDDIIRGVDSSLHGILIPSIFRLFELHPTEDFGGAPGALIHLIESFYPDYLPLLEESILLKPSHNSILMINRILNSNEISEELRGNYMKLLSDISANPGVAEQLQNLAKSFIGYQNNK